MEAYVGEAGNVVKAWSQRAAIIRCMRTLRAPEVKQKMDELQQKQVEDALDPPMSLILAAAGAYGSTYVALRRPLRSRPLLLQLAACGPPAAVLCMGGLCIGRRLLKDLLSRDSALTQELRPHCSELV
ncbi:unnamed protein product [Symbiodinium pilosum]|uniref:Uncharacterized protein n=1 Tax=Symbiodinium pilosum TaxID=2952 RepID=A0A812NMW7_SYMPI|nr:unnamed protein product [Symbiodinium pilosum]